MDFSQYLDMYMKQKQIRGVTPTQGVSQQIFRPYFQGQAQADQQGKRLDLAERELADRNNRAAESLAFEKFKQGAMQSAAERGDTNAMVGNAISTAGSLGNLALLKKYGWFDRRYR